MTSTLTIPLPDDVLLPAVVCSYGYFILAPNRWERETQTLVRPLRVDGQIVTCHVTQDGARLRVRCDRTVSRSGGAAVKAALRRTLRVDEPMHDWYALCPAAAQRGFGRLYRSPTLFEDIVKTMTGCNVTWPNTMNMNRLLCEKVGGGAFPEPRQLAAMRPSTLKARCKVGYRAERIIRLARDVDRGELDLAWFESPDRSSDELDDALRQIHGIGPYAAANLLQLLGHYDRIAIDTETYRHFRQVHDVPTPKDAAGLRRLHERIRAHYGGFAPYSFLAYWFELWTGYEHYIGTTSEQWGDADGAAFTASNLDQ